MATQGKSTELRRLLKRGDMTLIGNKLGMSRQAVSLAIGDGRPSHPAVIEAMRMARQSGALKVAQDMATLNPAA